MKIRPRCTPWMGWTCQRICFLLMFLLYFLFFQFFMTVVKIRSGCTLWMGWTCQMICFLMFLFLFLIFSLSIFDDCCENPLQMHSLDGMGLSKDLEKYRNPNSKAFGPSLQWWYVTNNENQFIHRSEIYKPVFFWISALVVLSMSRRNVTCGN